MPSPSGLVYIEGGGDSGWAGAFWTATPAGVWVQMLGPVEPMVGEPVDAYDARRDSLGALELGPCLMYPWSSAFVDNSDTSVWTTLVSTWLLMGQTLTTHEQVRPPRAASRRLVRRGYSNDLVVTTVTLRRHPDNDSPLSESPSENAAGTHDHRWQVNGHWRNQWYPSAGVHRPIWIDPYLKGPEGAPLLHSEQVYVLRR